MACGLLHRLPRQCERAMAHAAPFGAGQECGTSCCSPGQSCINTASGSFCCDGGEPGGREALVVHAAPPPAVSCAALQQYGSDSSMCSGAQAAAAAPSRQPTPIIHSLMLRRRVPLRRHLLQHDLQQRSGERMGPLEKCVAASRILRQCCARLFVCTVYCRPGCPAPTASKPTCRCRRRLCMSCPAVHCLSRRASTASPCGPGSRRAGL